MKSCSHCGLSHDDSEGVCPITEESLDHPGLCGSALDRYHVEAWLGGGGFGAVYRARHTVMDRRVALKVLHAQMRTKPLAVKRFFGEAKAATAIGHPGIVQVFDAGTTPEGHAFLAMELVEGCSLKELAEVDQLETARAIRIVVDVIDALAAAHEAGIIHRDVKPGNIMLGGTTPDGSETRDDVRLVDFGVSKARQTKEPEEITRSGMAMGSPGYASPEQYVSAKTADARSDIYGISVVLYQLLAGSLPFEAESYEQMVVQVCSRDPRPLSQVVPSLPSRLTEIVDRGLARDPDARWQRAEDLRAALLPWIDKLEGAFAATRIAPSTPPPKLASFSSEGKTPTFIEASPEDDLEADVDEQEEQEEHEEHEVVVKSDLPGAPIAHTAKKGAIVIAAVALAALAMAAVVLFVASRGDTTDAEGGVGSAPVPVVPSPVAEPTVPVPMPPSEPDTTSVEVAAPAGEEATEDSAQDLAEDGAEDGVVMPAAPRRTARSRRRGRAMRPEPGTETAPMAAMREFGFEDIEPFDPD